MTNIIQTANGDRVSKTSLESKTNAELVEIYNEHAELIGGTTVKKFADSKTALRRTWNCLVAWVEAGAPTKSKETKKKRKPRGMRFVFPVGDEIKPVRENTNRHKLLKLLQRKNGATFEECLKATWGDRTDMTDEIKVKATYEGIRLLHYYSGYGLRQDEKGRIHAVTA